MPAVATAAGLPSRLGKYELLLPLAAGGMARIYIARSTGIGAFERHVVLKIITPERANDVTAVNMFLDEARLAASLNHQNVAQVFEVGEDAGIHYLAMEYVHGQDLRAVLAKAGSQGTRIPLELALTVVAGAAAGLNHAHERRGPDGTPLGIVHRDVSPSNIMIGYDGAVKLLDFGIAKATARSVETQSGIIKGKFAYMAPEQCRGREVDRRSDVFSLGIILYEISTQHRCFRADSDFDTMHRIVTGDVVRPTRLIQGYPQALEAIVMKALAVDAAQRYQSAGLLLEALESFAVSSRMSLSTMGLGRFMRDMFGEMQEPWLNTAATRVVQPIAKESTISSTNSKSSPSGMNLPEAPEVLDINDSGIVEDEGVFPDSGSINAAKTILDLPREQERGHEPEESRAEWNAKSYPPAQPSMASTDTLRPEAQLRPSYPSNIDHPLAGLEMPPEPGKRRTSQPFDHMQPLGTQPPMLGEQAPPLPPPPGGQFHGTPGSGSGPAIPALGIPSTKHGYASAAMSHGDVSYPRYEPPDALVGDLQLKPNRRPLIIGLVIVLLGVIAMLVVMLGGSKDEVAAPDQSDQNVGPDKGSAAADQAAQGSAETDENMVSVVIKSDPPGADVVIAGSKVGVTPYEGKLHRGASLVPLTVRRQGYVDFVGKIDLGGDYENSDIKLVRVEDAGSATKPGETGDKGAADKSTGEQGTPTGDDTDKAGAGSATTKTGTATKAPAAGATTKAGTGTGTAKTGTGIAGTTTPKTANGTAKTGTGTTATVTTKTGTGTTGATKTNTGDKATGDKGTGDKGTGDKASAKPKCQPPGPNLDPFIPVCKS